MSQGGSYWRTWVPLEEDGMIEKRVERCVCLFCLTLDSFFSRLTPMNTRLYANHKANPEWISDLHNADDIIVAAHSQGSIVSTHLLDRLIRDGHIFTSRNQDPDQNPKEEDQQDLVMPLGLVWGWSYFHLRLVLVCRRARGGGGKCKECVVSRCVGFIWAR